jgi:hypothetical protein
VKSPVSDSHDSIAAERQMRKPHRLLNAAISRYIFLNPRERQTRMSGRYQRKMGVIGKVRKSGPAIPFSPRLVQLNCSSLGQLRSSMIFRFPSAILLNFAQDVARDRVQTPTYSLMNSDYWKKQRGESFLICADPAQQNI